jgi:hypothetical protein
VPPERSEDLLDVAESHVAMAIMQGDLATIRWWLPLKGLSSGWTQRGANLNGGITAGRGGIDIAAAIAADDPILHIEQGTPLPANPVL